MKYTFLLFALFWMNTVHPQKPSSSFTIIQDIYNNWSKTWSDGEFKCDSFYFTQSADERTIEEIKSAMIGSYDYLKSISKESRDSILKKKIVFDSSELTVIFLFLDKLGKASQTQELFPHSRYILHKNIVEIILQNRNKDLKQRVCTRIYTFSAPLFLRDETICVIYLAESSVIGTDQGLWIFKFTNGKWQKAEPLYLGFVDIL